MIHVYIQLSTVLSDYKLLHILSLCFILICFPFNLSILPTFLYLYMSFLLTWWSENPSCTCALWSVQRLQWRLLPAIAHVKRCVSSPVLCSKDLSCYHCTREHSPQPCGGTRATHSLWIWLPCIINLRTSVSIAIDLVATRDIVIKKIPYHS